MCDTPDSQRASASSKTTSQVLETEGDDQPVQMSLDPQCISSAHDKDEQVPISKQEEKPSRKFSLELSDEEYKECTLPSGYTTPDANLSLAGPDEELDIEQNQDHYAQTDANPFASKKSLRRQSAVEVPRTPQCEIRSPVADRHAENYNMDFPRRGIALILNHMDFDHEEYRHGSDEDCKRLSATLKKLGFEVRVEENLKYDQLTKKLRLLAQENHSYSDCLLVAVLTHGGRGELHTKDYAYPVERLWTYFTADQCPTLAAKPKIFIIQACRGMKVESGTVVADTVDSPKGQNFYTIPNHADILLANSTADGYYAWRNPKEGSWYIKTLCEELEKYADSRDLATILTFVSRRVAIECESMVPDNPKMHLKKQIPCVINMLTRLIYFKNKNSQAAIRKS